MGNKKLHVWLPLLFSLVLIIGMVLGYKLNDNTGSKNGFFGSNSRNSLQEALDLIKLRYVDTVNIGLLEGKAIQEIMKELDPHSVYLPPVNVKAANEDLAGNFEGIGVEFNTFKDTVHVVYVIPKGPSDKAGLQIGDRIIAVNEISLVQKSFDADSIKKYIRGERNSNAVLQIVRNNRQQSITVTRGTIPVSSIDAAYMIDKSTGYIKLNKFTESSYEEFMAALEKLNKEGMQSLIYDLRGNVGGFMNEAVEMADEFLDGDKLIVYTSGVNSKKREYRCKRPGLFEKGKLVLIVDEISASASEVLAGALQDWCRATIIGRRTFGKGLVQEQYPLSDGSAIRLTIARYYTPLGRSIQRSYAKGNKIYMDEFSERYNSGELLSQDSVKTHANEKKYITGCKDTLYGGEGIAPHFFVPLDTSLIQRKILMLFTETNISNVIYQYYLENKQKIDQYKSAHEYSLSFNASELWNKLVNTANGTYDFNKLSAKETMLLQQQLKARLARYKWRNEGFFQVINNEDNAVREALLTILK